MKKQIAFVLCLMSYVFVLGASAALTHDPFPLPPFAFAGRVVDYAHVAYDADQKVEILVKDEAGNLLAKGSTFTSGRTRYNFAVDVPIADGAARGHLLVGCKVTIDFVDPDGVIYRGLVTAGDSVIGLPGKIRKLDVVLGTDSNGDGISDEYVESLAYLMWKNGKETYDPDADWDGDGANNRQEYVAGTNPFDAKDRFSVREMAMEEGMGDYLKLTFPVNQGRTYTVETAGELAAGDWRAISFKNENGETAERISTASMEAGYRAIYVLKENVSRQFWKLKVE